MMRRITIASRTMSILCWISFLIFFFTPSSMTSSMRHVEIYPLRIIVGAAILTLLLQLMSVGGIHGWKSLIAWIVGLMFIVLLISLVSFIMFSGYLFKPR